MVATANRKKKVSKRHKSSWRKHVNITDVEEFLEDKRLEERLGPPLATLTNEELFKVDARPSLELLSAKEKRKLKASKPLKCFSALQPHTKVPDPVIKRNRVRTKEERKNFLVKLKELKNKENGILKAKDILAIKNRELDDARRKQTPKRGDFNKDIWNENDELTTPKSDDDWLTTHTKKHNIRGRGIPVKNVRKSVRIKPSVLPSIEPPHPGMSYNPSYEDHQDLLKSVAEKELKFIKEDARLTRSTTGMFEKVTEGKRDTNWLLEMSEGLPSKNETSIDNDNSDDEYKSINPPVENKKKSLKQRRKQKEQMALEKARNALKLEKKKITDIHKIKQLKEHIEKLEKKQKLSNEKRKKTLKSKKNKTKMLGALKFEEPEEDFHMAHEISGNLKNMKVEGNLLLDRFKSLQKRNILAPTKRQVHKKSKVKKYTKPGHKDEEWKKTVAR